MSPCPSTRPTITSLALACAIAFAMTGMLWGQAPPAEPRYALIIGNNNYSHANKLKNAANDAKALGAQLRKLGFQADVVTDADKRAMEAAIDRFVGHLGRDSVGLFHFSGHGMQVDQENYLVPVDFQLTDEASVKYDAYPASKLHDRMASAGGRLNIVILDACRNNGFSASRSGGSGLAAMNAARGSFIAFATAPGSTASDNPRGNNGLFTSYLLEALQSPGLKLDEVFNQVREGVFVASNKKQLAWTSSSVIGDFYFTPGEKSERDLVYVRADDQAPGNTAGEEQGSKQLPPPDPGPSADVVRESLIMLGARAGAVKASVERLRGEQAAQGVSLRGDMAASLDRMEFFLGEAEANLNNNDAERAQRNVSLADREVTKLEKFLGR